MRLVLLIALGACNGDNVRPARLDVAATVPAGTRAIAIDGDVATSRGDDGVVRRLVGGQWRAVGSGYRAIDFGTASDGAVLVMSSIPRRLYRVNGEALDEVGDIVLANLVNMPVQVPSGFHYVKELEGEGRSFVLTNGATTWAETPPMFFSRPVRAHDGTLYAMVTAGVQRFEADGTRTIAVECAALGKVSCTQLVLGGADDGRVVLGDVNESEVIVAGDSVERVVLPDGVYPARIATGKGVTIVLAKTDELQPADEKYFLYALHAGAGHVELVDDAGDAPSEKTMLAVDRAGTVWVATSSIAKVVP